jgi:hypothetical protein
VPAASSAAAQVHAALDRLRRAGDGLRARPRAEILAVLGALLEALRTKGSPERLRLEAELPSAAGFHPATVAEGAEAGFAPLTRDALLALARSELGPEAASARRTAFR